MTTDTIGGVWTFTRELSAGVLEAGHTVLLFSVGDAPNRQHLGWVKRMKDGWQGKFEFIALDVPLEWMQANAYAFNAAKRAMLQAVEEFCPDIIHANQYCFGALPVSLPVVVSAHSDVLSWSEACRGAPPEDSPWITQYRHIVQSGLTYAQRVIAPTRWMLDALGKNFHIPGSTHVVPNGKATLSPRAGSRKMQAITAGRLWDEAKGVSILNEIDSPIPLLLAGEHTCQGCVAPAVDNRVRSLGRLSEQDLLKVFAESAVYLCTSIYEPFGLAPLEAAGCGCAIVARDIPSLREVWGGSALYFRDAASLTKLLKGLHSDPNRLAHAQASAGERARTYTRQRLSDAYLEIFKQAFSRHTAASHDA